MSETQALLARISSLRQRLEQSRKQTQQTIEATDALGLNWPGPGRPIVPNLERLRNDTFHDVELDQMVAPLTGPVLERSEKGIQVLTSRSRRILEKAREMLARIRSLSSHFQPLLENTRSESSWNPGQISYSHPLARIYRETTSLMDTTVRMIPLLPSSATGQIHLCEGLDGILDSAQERLRIIEAGIESHRAEMEILTRLMEIYSVLVRENHLEFKKLYDLSDEILTEAQKGLPIRFPEDLSGPQDFQVANHCLCTSRVVSRLALMDKELRGRQKDAVVAALIHDVGRLFPIHQRMEQSNSEPHALNDHCTAGMALLKNLDEEWIWLQETTGSHHELLDGTGYPNGFSGNGIGVLTRLISVCENYVSLCCGNLDTAARDPRFAMTDTLRLADQGKLDRRFCQYLLSLSFYPVSTAVEMSDGSTGIVIQNPQHHRDWVSLSRPVVAILLDANGIPRATPRIVDLSRSLEETIVRGLRPRERMEKLGLSHPEWVAA